MTFARLCALALVHAPFVDIMHLNRGYYGEFSSILLTSICTFGLMSRR